MQSVSFDLLIRNWISFIETLLTRSLSSSPYSSTFGNNVWQNHDKCEATKDKRLVSSAVAPYRKLYDQVLGIHDTLIVVEKLNDTEEQKRESYKILKKKFTVFTLISLK